MSNDNQPENIYPVGDFPVGNTHGAPLSSLPAPLKLVPREPTEEMRARGVWTRGMDDQVFTWQEMFDAAPPLSDEQIERAAMSYDRFMRPMGCWVSLNKGQRARKMEALKAALAALQGGE